jgi:hypothetical protein
MNVAVLMPDPLLLFVADIHLRQCQFFDQPERMVYQTNSVKKHPDDEITHKDPPPTTYDRTLS